MREPRPTKSGRLLPRKESLIPSFAFAVRRERFYNRFNFSNAQTAPRALIGFTLLVKPRFRDGFCPGCIKRLRSFCTWPGKNSVT
jgi:hypothetical protein